MPFQDLIILLPCHSLDDFPVYHTGEDAQGLLASWSAMWHPRLIASARKIPSWQRSDSPPEKCHSCLLIVPAIGARELPSGFIQRAEQEEACLIQSRLDRDEIAAVALEFLGAGPAVDRELVLDFHALGYCYLQVQLLTRQMRYSSNLDEVFFAQQVTAAAEAALAGDEEKSREKLQSCFDVLAEERDHFYPVDAFLLDLTLVASPVGGESLRNSLQVTPQANLLVSGRQLEMIAESEPASIEALRSAIAAGHAELIGGEYEEYRLPLLSQEAIRAELDYGLCRYEELLGSRPTIFGRRRFGLTPALPQLLLGFGFQGALHATLDDGRFPEGMQIKTRWEGTDDAVISALAKIPVDASKPETFLNLAIKMGEAMDMDHVATTCFAHWAGDHSIWYEDLQRIAKFSGALGRFVSFSDFLTNAEDPGHQDRFTADQYRLPYLRQAASGRQIDPISRSIVHWEDRALRKACRSLAFLIEAIGGSPETTADANDLRRLTSNLEGDGPPQNGSETDANLPAKLQELAELFARQMPRKSGSPRQGGLWVNPSSFVRRTGVATTELAGRPPVGKPIYAADSSDGKLHVVADVPSLGFVWVDQVDKGGAPSTKKRAIPLAEEFQLRNEYCELLIDQRSGGLRSIHEYQSRQNRLTQQLAIRYGKRGSYVYSSMVAESIRVLESSTVCGKVESQGTLVDDDDKALATFTQCLTIWRGDRVITIDIELDPQVELGEDPWNNYACCRWAWKDDAADLSTTVNELRHPVATNRFEGPEYVEIEHDGKRTTLLTGGVPYHRRHGLHMMDSLLIVRGERRRKFRMGIGIDVKYPSQAAESLLIPPLFVPQQATPPDPVSSAWLFHLDAKNVTATDWAIHRDETDAEGFRVRLLETMGRPANVKLQSFRPVRKAVRLDFQGQPTDECEVTDGTVKIELRGHQFAEIAAYW